MKSIWQDESRKELNERLRALAWNNPAQWGKFTAPKMVCHLADSLRMAMGDLKVAPKRLPIRYPPLKQLIIYVAPFPKGAPTAPELLTREPREWASDIADVQALLNRAARTAHDRCVAGPPGVRRVVEARLGRSDLPPHGSSSEAIRRVTGAADQAKTYFGDHLWTRNVRCYGTRSRRWHTGAARRCAAYRRALRRSAATIPLARPRGSWRTSATSTTGRCRRRRAPKRGTTRRRSNGIARSSASLRRSQQFDALPGVGRAARGHAREIVPGCDCRLAGACRTARDAAAPGRRENEERELLEGRHRRRARGSGSDGSETRIRLIPGRAADRPSKS